MGDEFKFHLFNWKIICASVQQRGLGVREVVYCNKVLLRKWLKAFCYGGAGFVEDRGGWQIWL